MKSAKNMIIISLACFCLSLLIENHTISTELSNLKNNLNKFDISFTNWDTGETLFWMRGIPDYDIGFALSNDGRVFWHKIGREHEYSTEPGVCSDTPVHKYAVRPAGCFDEKSRIAAESGIAGKPACILYTLVNVDRHRL